MNYELRICKSSLLVYKNLDYDLRRYYGVIP